MTTRPMFSIIIPVYNSEDYLAICVNSILAQSYRNFEVILVDDGSTDNSATICKTLAEADSRVRYTFQSNEGTSSARNTGIDLARGEYITFVDNDDYWISSNALTEIKATIDATRADVVMHRPFVFNDKKSRAIPKKSTSYANEIKDKPKDEQISFLIAHGLLGSAVWAKVCSACLVKGTHPIYFPKGMRNEDTYWSAEVLRLCNSIGWCDLTFYAYRKGHEYAQTSKPLTAQQLNDLSSICMELCDNVEKTVEDPKSKAALYSFIAYPYLVWMGQSALFKEPEKYLARYEEMTSFSFLLNFDLDKRVHLAKIASRIVGFSATCKICSLALKAMYHGIEAHQPFVTTQTIRNIAKAWYKEQPKKKRFIWLLFPEFDNMRKTRAENLPSFLRGKNISASEIKALYDDTVAEHDHIHNWFRGLLSGLLSILASYALDIPNKFECLEKNSALLPLIYMLLFSFLYMLLYGLCRYPHRINRWLSLLISDIHTAEINKIVLP